MYASYETPARLTVIAVTERTIAVLGMAGSKYARKIKCFPEFRPGLAAFF
jgi:hypothetical protein